jgi:hypothetical protein
MIRLILVQIIALRESGGGIMSETCSHTDVEPATAPSQTYTDALLAGLTPALHDILALDPAAAAKSAATSLDNLLAGLIAPAATVAMTDIADPQAAASPVASLSPAPDIALAYVQNTLDAAKAKTAYNTAIAAATAAWQTELANWTQARAQYDFSMSSALVALKATAHDATTTYAARNNPDSPIRSNVLYYGLRETVAAALQTFAGSAASAGAVLAGEAGAIMAAYATYLGALNAAQATLMNSQATAGQAFWQSVEQIRDAS